MKKPMLLQVPSPDFLVFGGTFDPFHQGHLDCMQHCLRTFPKSKLLLVPAFLPAVAQGTEGKDPQLNYDERIMLCQESLASLTSEFQRRVEISRIEETLSTPNYTYKTLQRLNQQYVGQSFALVIGADQFLSFHLWRNPLEILRLASLVVVKRNDVTGKEHLDLVGKILKIQWEPLAEGIWGTPFGTFLIYIDKKTSDAESTVIRQSIQVGEEVPSHWLPYKVEEFLRKHKSKSGKG